MREGAGRKRRNRDSAGRIGRRNYIATHAVVVAFCWSMLSTPALAPISLSYRLALIIESLCQAATVRCAQDRSVPTLILVFRAWVRLRRLAIHACTHRAPASSCADG